MELKSTRDEVEAVHAHYESAVANAAVASQNAKSAEDEVNEQPTALS